MRWSIRYQLLFPPLILLIGVAGISSWAAIASADRTRRQIEKQMQDVAHTLNESKFPLTEHVLEQMKGLSVRNMWSSTATASTRPPYRRTVWRCLPALSLPQARNCTLGRAFGSRTELTFAAGYSCTGPTLT